MTPYQLAWLEAHPHRDRQWLAARFAEGFNIHHIDGDRTNNQPDNLVLLEHTDHMRIHGMNHLGRLSPGARQYRLGRFSQQPKKIKRNWVPPRTMRLILRRNGDPV